MSNNEENTTLPNHVPMLEAGISHTVWKKAVLNLLMTRCPNAFKHVITGVEPKFAFPEIDVFTKVGRKEVTELAEVLASLTPDERALPVRDWDEPGPQFDTEDDHYYYRRSRHPDYAGPNGVIRHNFDFQDNGKRRSKYLNEERAMTWSVIERYLGTRVEAQVKIPNAEYDLHQANLDYMWLWNKVKFVHTGEGAHSTYLTIAKLISLKMMNNDYVPFHDGYWRARTELLERPIDPKDLLDNLLDAMFLINMLDSSNTVWAKQIDEELMKEQWSTAAEMTKRMQTALKTKEGVEAYAGTGVIQADVARTQHQKKKPNMRGSIDRKAPTIYGTRCLRCGKEGCRATTCKTVLAPGEDRCAECGEAHHSSMHQLVTKVKQARKAGKVKQNSHNKSYDNLPEQRHLGDKKAYAAMMTNEEALDDFDAQVEHLEANATLLDEYSDVEDDEEEDVEANATDMVCIDGYNTRLISMTTGSPLTDTEIDDQEVPPPLLTDSEESDDERTMRIRCNHLIVNPELTAIPAIEGPVDSACNGHLIDKRHMNHPDLTNLKACRGVGVQGVDRTASPIPVSYTAYHRIIGTVFIGDFGKNLFSVSRLFLDGWTMDGDHNHIHMRKRGRIIFTGHRDRNNMFIANITCAPAA